MTKTILVVEDNDDARAFILFYLESLNFRVVQATNGYDAVAIVKRTIPDLILMDLSLPEIDGFEATVLIKQVPGAESIPIIALTALGSKAETQALAAGCQTVLHKPVDLVNLSEVIALYMPG